MKKTKYYASLLQKALIFSILCLSLPACRTTVSLIPDRNDMDKDGFRYAHRDSQHVYARLAEMSPDELIFDTEFINESTTDSVWLDPAQARFFITGATPDMTTWVNTGVKTPDEFLKNVRRRHRNAQLGFGIALAAVIAIEVGTAIHETKQASKIANSNERLAYINNNVVFRTDRLELTGYAFALSARNIDFLSANTDFYARYLIRPQMIPPKGRALGLIVFPRNDAAKRVQAVFTLGNKDFPFEYEQKSH